MKRYAVLLLLLVGVAFLFNQAGRLLGQLPVAPMLGLEYAQGSVWRGKLFAMPDNLPLWLVAEWQWCPGWQPNRWCVDMQGTWGNMQGKLLVGWSGLELYDAQIQLNHLAVPMTPYLQATATVDAQMENLTLAYTGGLQAIGHLQGKAQVSKLTLAGLALADHQLTIQREPAEDFLLYIEGAQAQGTARLSVTGDYVADILLAPGEGLDSLFQGQLPQVSKGTFRYQANGRLEGI